MNVYAKRCYAAGYLLVRRRKKYIVESHSFQCGSCADEDRLRNRCGTDADCGCGAEAERLWSESGLRMLSTCGADAIECGKKTIEFYCPEDAERKVWTRLNSSRPQNSENIDYKYVGILKFYFVFFIHITKFYNYEIIRQMKFFVNSV